MNELRRRVPKAPTSAANWTWDGWTDMGSRRATKDIVDDFGTVQTYRRCRNCRSWHVLAYENFSTRSTRGAKIIEWDRDCRVCKVAANAQRYQQMTVEERAARNRRRYELMKSDPVRFEEWKRSSAFYKAQRPEHYRAIRRESARRSRARLKAMDPERYQERQVRTNERRRLRRLERREADAQLAATPLPARPLALAIHNWMRRRGISEDVAIDLFGISSRLLFAWRSGERQSQPLSAVDAFLVRGDLLWWEVYNEETVRRPIFTATSYRFERRRLKSGEPVVYRTVAAVTPYGDVGPDWDVLRMVQETFEGAPETLELAA
jgi:hypothetical protein